MYAGSVVLEELKRTHVQTELVCAYIFILYSYKIDIKTFKPQYSVLPRGSSGGASTLVAEFSNALPLSVNFFIFIFVFIAFYSILYVLYCADAPPVEPLAETDCCGLNVLMSIL